MAAAIGAVVDGGGWPGCLTRLASGPSGRRGHPSPIVVAVMPRRWSRQTWVSRFGGLAIVVVTAAGAAGARLLRAVWILATYLASLLIYFSLPCSQARLSFGRLIPTTSARSRRWAS